MAERNNLLVIGAGGVGRALLHKVAQHNDEFGDITIASLHREKCEQAIREVHEKGNLKDPSRKLVAEEVDAMDPDAVARLIERAGADLVINVASPYTNMTVMTGCLKAGAHYLDTAVFEEPDKLNEPAPWYALHEWKRKGEFEKAGLTCILSIGCDPGMVNVFAAYAKKHLFDEIRTIDIMDVNAGSHNRFFATNFDPEINLREILEDAIYWEDGAWRSVPHHTKKRIFDFPEVGEQPIYLMGHEEVHSLAVNFPNLKRVAFWMGFSDHYIQVFTTLEKLGLLGIEPIEVDGCKVIPIRVLKALLPDPTETAAEYRGKVCVGDLICGRKDGEERAVFIYSTKAHEDCFEEIGHQAISYTTAVPAVTAALLIKRGPWRVNRMVNAEELDPDPFMELMPEIGMPWAIREEEPARVCRDEA